MARNPLSLVEDLDGAIREARFHGFAQKFRTAPSSNDHQPLHDSRARPQQRFHSAYCVALARKPLSAAGPVERRRRRSLRLCFRCFITFALIVFTQSRTVAGTVRRSIRPRRRSACYAASSSTTRDDADRGLVIPLLSRASNARRQHDEAVVIGEILIRPGLTPGSIAAIGFVMPALRLSGTAALWHTAE